MSSQQVIEHIVLFNVKDNTDPSKLDAMVNGLNSLSSLPHVLHLSMGPVLRNRSNSFKFSHMLHSRYNSKEDLKGYSDHESHLKVVRGNVLPICDDVMAVDWVSEGLNGEIKIKPSSAIRVSFLKVKENLGAEEKAEIFKVFGEFKEEGFDSIDQISYGENFSPARAKGFSIASLAVFPGISELDALSSNEELMNKKKEKVRDFLEGVIVVDYVVPQVSQSASL
ncbi:Stress responsive alpha-beta barrel [Dillenia turbinata]|uniref:Stress responsive alpha-beta barrel n=1 Tax=Dillenia turbinata TaxID=194707 RepID=A0AAN8ZHH8_9MAGN